MKATFKNSVDVLVKAYLNDTLVHGNCGACAVGNLINDVMGAKNNYGEWYSVYVQESEFIDPSERKMADAQLNAIGYSIRNVIKIERAFESADVCAKNDRMFNGLMAVVSVLADIHQVDIETAESARKLFVKA